MSKLIRIVNQGIHDFFICNGEDLGDGCNQFENRLPDSFTDGQFMAVLIDLPEEFSDSLVVLNRFTAERMLYWSATRDVLAI